MQLLVHNTLLVLIPFRVNVSLYNGLCNFPHTFTSQTLSSTTFLRKLTPLKSHLHTPLSFLKQAKHTCSHLKTSHLFSLSKRLFPQDVCVGLPSFTLGLFKCCLIRVTFPYYPVQNSISLSSPSSLPIHFFFSIACITICHAIYFTQSFMVCRL